MPALSQAEGSQVEGHEVNDTQCQDLPDPITAIRYHMEQH